MRDSQASSCVSSVKKLLQVESCNYSVSTSCAVGVLCAVSNNHSVIVPSTQSIIEIHFLVSGSQNTIGNLQNNIDKTVVFRIPNTKKLDMTRCSQFRNMW